LYEVSKDRISSNWLYSSSSTTTFSIPTIPPPSHLFTDTVLPLHCSWVLSDLNYWALKLVTGVKCSSVTDFIARYQYRVISTNLSSPIPIGHWSVTDLTSPLPIG
jgi:hypothetical protein